SLAGPELEPLLGEPARAFFLAAAAAVMAMFLLPKTSPPDPLSHRTPFPRERGRHHPKSHDLIEEVPPLPGGRECVWERGPGGEGPRRARFWLRLQRSALRDPATALLALATAAALAITLWGGALIPRSGDLSPDGGSFTLFLPLPEGSTLEEAERLVRGAEKVFARTPEVVSFWSSAQAGRALVVAEVRPGDRQPDRLAALATRLRYQIPGAAAARIDTGLTAAGGSGLRLDPEERARADEEGFTYRAILRSADLGALRTAHDRLLGRLGQLKIRPHWITAWGAPSPVLSLRPVAGTASAAAAELASALRDASWPPASIPLPRRSSDGAVGAERALVVVPTGAPLDPE